MKNKTNLTFLIIAFAVFAVAALVGYYGPGLYHAWRMERFRDSLSALGAPEKGTDDFTASFRSVKKHESFMPFPALSAVSTDGQTIDLAGQRERPLLLNLWATWCAPCIVELPSLQALSKTYQGRMDVMAVSIDIGKKPADITAFLQKQKIGPFAAWLGDTGDFTKKLGIRGIPVSFLIGRDGGILYIFEGEADWNSPQAKAFFDSLHQNQ